jgi:hypothetical protein
MRTARRQVPQLPEYLSLISRSTVLLAPLAVAEQTYTFFVEADPVRLGLGRVSPSLGEKPALSARISQRERLALRRWCGGPIRPNKAP